VILSYFRALKGKMKGKANPDGKFLITEGFHTKKEAKQDIARLVLDYLMSQYPETGQSDVTVILEPKQALATFCRTHFTFFKYAEPLFDTQQTGGQSHLPTFQVTNLVLLVFAKLRPIRLTIFIFRQQSRLENTRFEEKKQQTKSKQNNQQQL
jgi:hypothetical protein